MRRANDLGKGYQRVCFSIAAVGGSTGLLAVTLSAPLTTTERLVASLTFVAGTVAATFFPMLRGVGARLLGLSVLSLALLPSFGVASAWMILSVVILGFAVANISMLVRVMIALPLALAASSFHAGHPIPTLMMAVWAVSTVVVLLTVNQLALARSGRTFEVLGGTPRLRPSLEQSSELVKPRFVDRWMRPLAAGAAIGVIVPLAIGLGYSVNVSLPQFALRSDLGNASGSQLEGHPGMTGTLDVGEPVNLSDDVVLRVETTQPQYWRATTYDQWDGRTWTSTSRWQPFAWDGGGVQPLSESSPDVTVPTANLRQVFRTEQVGFDVLLGAPTVTGFWTPAGSAQMFDDGTVRLDNPLGAQAQWTTDSTIALVDPELLRNADLGTGPVDQALADRYGFQTGVDREVVDLAQEITANAPTTYDKVKALEAWMDGNITYDRNITSLAPGGDAVTNLLFESKRGFCEQIGTALVVMLRSLGIPARLAVGYVPTEFDSSRGEWISRGSDAHAWAEVYFPGAGWQGFDPTANVPLAGDADSDSAQAFSVQVRTIVVGVFGALGLAATILVAWIGLKWLLDRKRRDRHPYRELQRRFNRCGELLGFEWGHSTTLVERAADLQTAGLNTDALHDAVERLQLVHYGPEDVGSGDLVAETELLLVELEDQANTLAAR